MQPDTVVPDPYYPLDWDRFAYARNNPIKFIDPTGHTVCTPDQPGCRKGYSNGLSPEQQFRKEIKKNFGWWVDPRFSIEQLRNIWRTGSDISRYVESVDPTKSGRDWVKLHMGNANLVLGGIPQKFVSRFNDRPTSVVFLKHTIWLSHSFDKMNLTHELAHVWDNNSVSLPDATATWEGFGIADQLTLFVGGTPTGWRWCNNTSGIPRGNRWQPEANGGYGNESTVEYFAEAVKFSIYGSGNLPQPWIQTWLNAIIYLQP